jgi:hypothetical protein
MQARSTNDLLTALTERTRENLRVAETFLALPSESLHQRPRPQSWNALECLAHLNKYSAYYLPEIRQRMATTKYRGNTKTFTSSWLGNKFAAGMKPGEKMRKISTPGNANPTKHAELVTPTTLPDFIRSQEEMLELLTQAAHVDLTKTTTGTSLTNLLRLRLGDTLRIVVYHNWRHVEQAQRALVAEPVA